jgi:hypothetical protein
MEGVVEVVVIDAGAMQKIPARVLPVAGTAAILHLATFGVRRRVAAPVGTEFATKLAALFGPRLGLVHPQAAVVVAHLFPVENLFGLNAHGTCGCARAIGSICRTPGYLECMPGVGKAIDAQERLDSRCKDGGACEVVDNFKCLPLCVDSATPAPHLAR